MNPEMKCTVCGKVLNSVDVNVVKDFICGMCLYHKIHRILDLQKG